MKKLEPIGKYIQLSDVRNTDLSVTTLLGVAADKRYIPSVANVNGTDLSKYKVIHQGQFACNLMHVCRDGVLPVAMYKGEPAIISPAYPIFEVQDENNLLPEYLHMYLSRPEFDREAVFYAMKGIRGSLDWNDFIEMKIPIPDIDVQRKIVAEYQTIEKRIENNNRLIKVLEETAQNIYHHTFVENIDPNNLPEGWKISSIEDYFGRVTIGKTPPREMTDCFRTDGNGIKWVSIADMKAISPFVIQTSECLTPEAVSVYKVKVIPKNTILLSFKMTVGRVSITTEDMCTNEAIAHFVCKDKIQLAYTYFYLKDFDYLQLGNTSSISDAVNSKIIKKMMFIKPTDTCMQEFARKVSHILDIEYLVAKENLQLQKVLNLLLSKLS